MHRLIYQSSSALRPPCSPSRPALAQTLGMSIAVLRWVEPPAGPAIELLDQTRLPLVETIVTCRDVPSLVDSIKRLVVRGAPLLGIAGAYGVALAAARDRKSTRLNSSHQII